LFYGGSPDDSGLFLFVRFSFAQKKSSKRKLPPGLACRKSIAPLAKIPVSPAEADSIRNFLTLGFAQFSPPRYAMGGPFLFLIRTARAGAAVSFCPLSLLLKKVDKQIAA